MKRVLKYLVLSLAFVSAVPTFFILINDEAFHQDSKEVVVRDCGHIKLGPPAPASDMAKEDLPFAQLSTAAYDTAKSASGEKPIEWLEAEKKLSDSGWHPWDDTPTDTRFTKHNLRVQVWQNDALHAVVVTFGGTDPKKIADWWANFRWFIPRHNDEYTDVVQYFGTMFRKTYLLHQQRPDSAFLAHATLYATGHSLGGGLAQEFAYALPIDENLPRITKVYAFDPTPVTGYYSVEKRNRDINKRGLEIDRIYQRREILAILRSFMNLIHRPSAEDPRVREIRFNMAHGWNPVIRHSIPLLSAELEQAAAGDSKTVFPEPPCTR